MTTNKTAPITLARTGSHYVEFSAQRSHGFKEEVFLYYETEWRGSPCTVTMRADRYTHSGGLSEWRVTLSEARSGTYESNRWDTADLSPTAKQRLRERLSPLVHEWLASDDYRKSERAAYVSRIKRDIGDAHPYFDNPTRRMREDIAMYGEKLSEDDHDYLNALCDAFDTFALIYQSER